MSPTVIRRVSVVGTGAIGTSVALALRRAGVAVALADENAEAVAKAERMGAGRALTQDDPPADVVLIATPPSCVVDVLRDAQKRGLGGIYTDVASTKARISTQAELSDCDLARYVPGHPMAGSEVSGPAAARADLFAGRPWVLCPHPATPPEPVWLVAELVTLCGATPEILDPRRHDSVVAAISHVPHVVSAALAARFAQASDTMLALTGRGIVDVTRIAAGAPALWSDILRHNADHVAAELESVARDLAEAASALRGSGDAGAGRLTELLSRGNHGRQRILDAFLAAGRTGVLPAPRPEIPDLAET